MAALHTSISILPYFSTARSIRLTQSSCLVMSTFAATASFSPASRSLRALQIDIAYDHLGAFVREPFAQGLSQPLRAPG